jgi:hypothetical protein
MNYEKLTALAELLNKHHGRPKQHGFIVVPHSELQLDEHKKALVHSDRIFHYHPMSDEKLCICAVTREETVNEDSSVKLDYSHAKLEHIGYEALATPELAPLLKEYMEFVKSRLE